MSKTAKTAALSQRAETWLKVALAGTVPLVLIGLLEGVGFVWERTQAQGPYAWELVASRRMVWQEFPEPGAGYTLMQPGREYEWQGIPVDINSHGLRGPEFPEEKAPGTLRILNLGDSVAMGWGVREEEAYGRRLEDSLQDQGTGDFQIEVINAGVPGWNLDNALAYLEAEGLRYEPDLILMDVTVVNDINGKSALVADQGPTFLRWMRANTYLWPFLTVQLQWLRARADGRERIDVIDPPTDAAKYFPLDPEAPRWTERWDTVLAMNRLAAENRAGFVLILFPLEFQVLDEGFPTLPQDLFTARAAQAGIPVIDLLPTFQRACREKPGSCHLEDRYLFADVWMHPSAYGHQLAATEIQALVAQILPNARTGSR
jgi:lysophospholipase L1-like esterase